MAEPFELKKVFDLIELLYSKETSKEKLVVILGATSVGKSSLGLALAKKFDTEIISADSMAIYKNFDIGTAKPSKTELETVPHHLIDILEAEEKFSVGEFVRRVRKIILQLNLKGKIPIVVGGTGLYIQALLEGYEFETVKSSRSHYKLTKELFYDALVLGLTANRADIYKRIDQRTQENFSKGLVEEVIKLLENGVSEESQAMRGIGYKEVVEYLHGNLSLDETILKVTKNTRNFAKRQLTWFRRMKYIQWLEI